MDCIFLYCIVFKVCRFVDLYISMFMFTHYMSVNLHNLAKKVILTILILMPISKKAKPQASNLMILGLNVPVL